MKKNSKEHMKASKDTSAKKGAIGSSFDKQHPRDAHGRFIKKD